MFDAATLRELIAYNPETGSLRWRHRPNQHSWNTRYAGKECGALTPPGYVNLSVHNKSIQAHTVAWIIMTGVKPNGQIDHRNGIRNDNRWKNLRDVTSAENQKNLAVKKNNRSGHPGVEAFRGKWRAVIMVNRRPIRLGTFTTFDQAKAARVEAEKSYGFTVRK